MLGKNYKLGFSLFVILAMISVVPAFGASAVVGSVAGGTNATIGGQALVPNTTLFSGDSLRVKDGAAVVAVGMGSRMAFGRETVASFERGTEEVTVLLGQGNVSLYHPENGMAMRVKVGDVTVLAEKGYKSLGDVAMVNGGVVVSAKEGMLRVQGPERTVELTKGKTIAITPKTAGSPQPQGAGAATTHLSSGQWVAVGGLAAGGTGATMGFVNLHKINQTKDIANKADTDALAAQAAATAAQQAAAQAAAAAALANQNAIAAGMIAAQTCLQISPTNPNCTFTPGQ